ncbi:hypothetical protein GCM10011514_25780 [Emticicia aquatilis]|uniref:Uncharacterized protein n=1 Tax=Emticicia aquatilis TaxID=1537369 RepID=A0A917DR05_9BACT|nr:hypothetical protein [Emticicia aquatilis]GGD60680.1 hypothetical protein GCM10011514_25780 [Emticicia aquatilis]
MENDDKKNDGSGCLFIAVIAFLIISGLFSIRMIFKGKDYPEESLDDDLGTVRLYFLGLVIALIVYLYRNYIKKKP